MLLNRFEKFFTKQIPALVLLLFFAFLGTALFFINRLEFNYNIDASYAPNDSEVAFYRDSFQVAFEDENDYLLIGIEREEGVFNFPFLNKIKQFSDTLTTVKGIKKVISISNSFYYKKTPLIGMRKVQLLNISPEADFEAQKNYIYHLKEYHLRQSFSKDTTAVQLALKLNEGNSYGEGVVLLNKIRALSKYFDFSTIHLGGRIRTQEFYKQTMFKEMASFSSIAILMLFFSTWLMLKD
jgi:predicted RND superfamily exporter protein